MNMSTHKRSYDDLLEEIKLLKNKINVYSQRPCPTCNDRNCTFCASVLECFCDDKTGNLHHNAHLSNVGSMLLQARQKIVAGDKEYVKIVIEQVTPKPLKKRRKIIAPVPKRNNWNDAYGGFNYNNSQMHTNTSGYASEEEIDPKQYGTIDSVKKVNMRWKIRIEKL